MIKESKISAEILLNDKEALGRFLTKDPKVQEIIKNCISAGNLKGRVTEEEIISHLYLEVVTKEKNWLNHDIDDIYSYLCIVIKRMLFLNKYSQRSFMKEEHGFDKNIDSHSTSFEEVRDDERKYEERLRHDEESPSIDYAALLDQFKRIVQIIWEKNSVNGELMYRRYILQEDLFRIAQDFLRRGLIHSSDDEHAYLSLVNRRLPAARDMFDEIALKMNYRLRFEKKKRASTI